MVLLARLAEKSRELWERLYALKTNNEEKKADELKRLAFMKELKIAQTDLEAARNNYNFTKDAGLLEYYIYEMKAAETRVNYYMKLAKRENYCNRPDILGINQMAGKGEGAL